MKQVMVLVQYSRPGQRAEKVAFAGEDVDLLVKSLHEKGTLEFLRLDTYTVEESKNKTGRLGKMIGEREAVEQVWLVTERTNTPYFCFQPDFNAMAKAPGAHGPGFAGALFELLSVKR
jgi:hypothetical protein